MLVAVSSGQAGVAAVPNGANYSPRFGFFGSALPIVKDKPKVGYPWQLNKLYFPTITQVGVATGTPALTQVNVVFSMLMDGMVVYSQTIDTPLALVSSSGGLDTYQNIGLLAVDLTTSIIYRNGSNITFKVDAANTTGVAADFFFAMNNYLGLSAGGQPAAIPSQGSIEYNVLRKDLDPYG